MFSEIIFVTLFTFSVLVFPSNCNIQCFDEFKDGSDYQPHPDIGLDLPSVIWKYGFKSETHKVETDDGHILTVFRIIKRDNPNKPFAPIYLNHGLFSNGHSWVMQNGTSNLAFNLAEEGFDVWIANSRGTAYSLEHKEYSPEDPLYWKFSFHEMGIHDIPKIINHIKEVTNTKKIYYIGYSMGTTQLFIALSEKKELNDDIALAILYAPVGYLTQNAKIIGTKLAPMGKDLFILGYEKFKGRFNAKELFEEYFGESLGEMCAHVDMACGICSEIVAKSFGSNPMNIDHTLLSLLFSHVPDTVSARTLLHYSQFINSGKFQKFDYGSPYANVMHYGEGQDQPPEYDLKSITAPLVLFWGEGDRTANPADVMLTLNGLNQSVVKGNFKLERKDFSHVDFVLGIDVSQLLYEKTVEMIKQDYFKKF